MSTKSLAKQHSNGKSSSNGKGAHEEKRARKVTTSIIRARKGGKKITSVTAYDYPTAKLVDGADVDVILVGDSLGMVVLGYPDTTKVTLDDMVHHTQCGEPREPQGAARGRSAVPELRRQRARHHPECRPPHPGRMRGGGETRRRRPGEGRDTRGRGQSDSRDGARGPHASKRSCNSAASRCRARPMKGRIRCCATRWPCRRAARSRSCSRAYRRRWALA